MLGVRGTPKDVKEVIKDMDAITVRKVVQKIKPKYAYLDKEALRLRVGISLRNFAERGYLKIERINNEHGGGYINVYRTTDKLQNQ